MSIGLKLTCQNGHTQAIRTEGMSRAWVEHWGKLMDGTSPFFVHPVRDDDPTMIGKCGICRARVSSEVIEMEEGAAADQVAIDHGNGSTTIRQELPPVDRSRQQLTDGSPVPEDCSHTRLKADGQQEGYVVLSPEERAKGFIRPVRRTYLHRKCGTTTTMGLSIAETYARDPKFYSGTFCCHCGTHLPLEEFVWEGTNEQVGS